MGPSSVFRADTVRNGAFDDQSQSAFHAETLKSVFHSPGKANKNNHGADSSAGFSQYDHETATGATTKPKN